MTMNVPTTRTTAFLQAAPRLLTQQAIFPKRQGQNRRCPSARHRRAFTVLNSAGSTSTASPTTPLPLQTPNPAEKPETAFDFSDPTFATAVSGEWFGHEVTFSGRTGDALSIEERFIPDEFRDWDVEVLGFDNVTSTTVTAENILHVKRTRALPTVGCEADAIVPDIHTADIEARTSTTFNGGFSDGSYSLGDLEFPTNLSQTWTAALCYQSTDAPPRRARVVFGRVDEQVGKVALWIERWDAPFSNGALLPGCGGPDSSFATEPRLQPGALAGIWDTVRTVHDLSSGTTRSLTERVSREAIEVFALPRGLSVRIATRDDGSTVVEAGWLIDDTVRKTVQRVYASSGRLCSVELATETRVSQSQQ